VITSKDSGNIQVAAQQYGTALIYDNEAELFKDDHIVSKISQLTSCGLPTGKFVFTGTSTAFLRGQST
jgi:hypothetical protein